MKGYDSDVLKASTQLVSQYLDVPVPIQDVSESEIIAWLTVEIEKPLATDLEKLVNSAYRFDVDEYAFHQAFQLAHPAYVIAQLFYKKALEKAYWRAKYANQ